MFKIRHVLLCLSALSVGAGLSAGEPKAETEAEAGSPFLFPSAGSRVAAATLLWENDSIAGTDKQYTNGTRIELTLGAEVDRETFFAPVLSPFYALFEDRDEIYGTLFLGQNMYTPQDITIPELEIAVEWNGIFHYKPIGGKKRLRKIKAKDRMKVQRLSEMDWFFYVVKHEKRYDPNVVESHFDILCEVINQKLH